METIIRGGNMEKIYKYNFLDKDGNIEYIKDFNEEMVFGYTREMTEAERLQALGNTIVSGSLPPIIEWVDGIKK